MLTDDERKELEAAGFWNVGVAIRINAAIQAAREQGRKEERDALLDATVQYAVLGTSVSLEISRAYAEEIGLVGRREP
jgi:hypothetical protein